MAISTTVVAQQTPVILRVDINKGSVNGDGSAWGTDAFRFLQDALAAADLESDPVEIWVASSGNDDLGQNFQAPRYRPDQSKDNDPFGSLPDPYCHPYGDCIRTHSFELRNNVTLYGGFPPNPHDYHGTNDPATFEDRDWIAYPTMLSGDVRAVNVSATAVLDGFIIQGGTELRGARPLFRDCVFMLHEGAAVRCIGGSEVLFHRCIFTGAACGAIVVDEGSRLALVACEPSAALGDVHRSGIADVSPCSELIAVDGAHCRAEPRATHLAPGQ